MKWMGFRADAELSAYSIMGRARWLTIGIVVALAVPAAGLIGSILSYTLSYNGKCGGFLPWLAGERPCTLREYVFGNLSLTVQVVLLEYWPIIILLLALPVAIGFTLDLQKRRSTE